MRNSPESPILLGEGFLIRDAVDSRPILAHVIQVNSIENMEGIWQTVGLQRLTRPQIGFEMSTFRRIGVGAYTNRDNRYTFLRTSVLELKEMSRFFNNGARQLAEELLKEFFTNGREDHVRALKDELPLSGLAIKVAKLHNK